MRFNGLDLNLLVALDAVLRERNVTSAARSLNLSQPAMSAAVSRLRQYFQDELFVMQGREMVLTPLGTSLGPPVNDILQRVTLTLTPEAPFDPWNAKRRFRVIISDFLAIVFFSKIVSRAATVAPNITFELLPFDDDPDGLLREGRVDFLLFPEVYLQQDHPKASLFEESLVCVACPENKLIGGELTLEQYLTLGHVAAQFGNTRKPAIEEWLLLKYGVKRSIEVTVQAFSIIPYMVVGTNRIATMHLRLAEHYSKVMPLRIFPLPLPIAPFVEAVQWPTLSDRDPASIWMRQFILEQARREIPEGTRMAGECRVG